MTEIKYIPIGEIKPYPKNAKKHPKKQIEQVAASIKEFGFNQPLVLDKNGVLIVGHGRLEAAKLLGLKEVPTITVDLTEEQAKAYRLADNKLNESDWEMDLVISELKELSVPMLELTGFEKDLVLEPDEKDDVVPEVPEEPKAKLGDIYQLGKHRVMCGDSTKIDDVEKLMEGNKADMVITDPPYAIFGSSTGVSSDVSDDAIIKPLFQSILRTIIVHTHKFSHAYIFCDWRSWAALWGEVKYKGLETKNMIVWDKKTRGMGAMYANQHELLLFLTNVCRTQAVRKGEAGQKTVNKDENIWKIKREKNTAHNAQKPVELCVRAILNSTQKKQKALDLFLGSGSTLIACEKTNRICYGMELDPKYIDVIIKRWEDYTGQKAILINNAKQL